ncbi:MULTISPECIES: DEAD/DEAH box helicase [Spirosoma]|uniref:DEAD/DEAH box helicase n=1 Tax=Spirosoma sordidisoli TaxID=2502893 RepID=A0A4Q2UJZ9_9BACT|nr:MULTISPECIES: DEAD/DEAH box helicase [Spirosoma]RYC67790.1 DEAD/DEAH box helicase [Spirosoma sordidisoli]
MEITSFDQFEINRQLLNAVADLGYTEPTPIQQKTIPLSLGNHDVLGIAQTGTGKTAAYLLPLLMKVKYAQGTHPRALILAPTRELALQINEAISQLAKYTDLRHLALYGGLGPKKQIETLSQGVDILVATPGRFIDLYRLGHIVTKDIRTMILDEADKMMDMGFMPQIRAVLEVIPSKRQNLLFSATFGGRVERLSSEFLEAPIKVEVTPQASTAAMVNQVLYQVPNFRTKINLLDYLVTRDDFTRGIIFARTKGTADNIYKFLARKVIESDQIRVIHANKGQNTRINSMEAFKEGNIRVLVSTDVAARGIDVVEVSHVINFDVPLIYEDYVHRIGRTGRANHTGEAITFMTIAEEYHVQKIEKIIRMTIPRVPIPRVVEITETPFDEQQALLREVDEQRRKEDPTFLGAFHEKKAKNMAPARSRTGTSRPGSSAKPASRSTGPRPRTGAAAGSKPGGSKRSGGRGNRR